MCEQSLPHVVHKTLGVSGGPAYFGWPTTQLLELRFPSTCTRLTAMDSWST